MKQTFYSNGKLLITAEYLVLDGATALALPTKYGQNLVVESSGGKVIHWKSFDSDGSIWFEETISFAAIRENLKSGNHSEKNTLTEILHEAFLLNPENIDASEGYSVCTALSFPRHWGLGTSSTLINNVAQWFGVDAFELLRNSFGGSGYDIACAQSKTAVLYRLDNKKPLVKTILFKPEFSGHLYFVYLNKKQNSKAAIASYRNKHNDLKSEISTINSITDSILDVESLAFFSEQLEKHEAILSKILQMPTVKETFFPDFNGAVKSLGAWGGDFVLAVSAEDPTAYFSGKGFETIIRYSQMIL